MTKIMEKESQENSSLLHDYKESKIYYREFKDFSKIFIKDYLERFNIPIHKDMLRRIKETNDKLDYFLKLCGRKKAQESWDKLNILNQKKKNLKEGLLMLFLQLIERNSLHLKKTMTNYALEFINSRNLLRFRKSQA